MIKLFTAIIAAFLLCTFSYSRVQAEEVKELVMKTDVGVVALTVELCELQNSMHPKYRTDYVYKAYATEEATPQQLAQVHPGCWTDLNEPDMVYIHFPELGDLLVTYRKDKFHPKLTL